MLKARTRWQVAAFDETLSARISEACGISPLLARLLVMRGMDTPERAKDFLHVSPEQFRDPFLLDGMEKSVTRIRKAIMDKERICIYGDYDADGVSSTALMVHLMRELGAQFDYYIPNRFKEGYGLNKEALSYIYNEGFKVVVTVDTGISAVEQVAFGQELGLDIIVTDHHEPPEVIPDAYAVINPKKPGCPYPFEMLAGVGVAFKVAHALLGEPPMHLADLAAIGTIADLVPLVDENRILASFGLKRLNQTRNVGLQALIRVSGLAEKKLTAGHVGFALGPRINASGRLETAEAAVKLLTADSVSEAEQYAQILDDLNRERQELVQQMTEEAEAMVLENFPPAENQVLVLAKEGWNVGVVGIVASRLVEKFYRPTIVLGIDEEKGIAKGSARSINGFDMYEALTLCKELLPHYGGHTMAAGMTLPVEHLAPFREQLNQIAREWLTEEDFVPQTQVDLVVELDDIGLELAAELEALAPFGMGNKTPLLLCKDVETAGMRKIGRDDNHLKCSLVRQDKTVDAIGFNIAHVAEDITPSAKLHIVGELDINEWNGIRKPQLLIRDLAVEHRQLFDWRGIRDKEQRWMTLAARGGVLTIAFREENYQQLQQLHSGQTAMPSLLYISRNGSVEESAAGAMRTLVFYDLPFTKKALQQSIRMLHNIERIYCMFGDPDASFDNLHFPTREQFKALYQIFRAYPAIAKTHLGALAKKLSLKQEVVTRMLAIFAELGFVQDKGESFELHTEPVKAPLESSILYTEWKEETELATELLFSSQEALLRYLSSTS